jgi:hypothetical protein
VKDCGVLWRTIPPGRTGPCPWRNWIAVSRTYKALEGGFAMRMKELIEDMSRLEMELHTFETKFGVKSADFYEAMTRGELEEFDALDEYRMEFIEWLALYKTWLSLNEKYHQLVTREPVALQIKANLELSYA